MSIATCRFCGQDFRTGGGCNCIPPLMWKEHLASEQRITELTTENAALKQQLEGSRLANKAYRETIDQLRGYEAQAIFQVKAERAENAKLKQRISELEAENESLKAQLTRLFEISEGLTADGISVWKHKESQEAYAFIHAPSFFAAAEQNKKLQKENAQLKADLANCETENNNLRQHTVDMAHLEAENERLKQDAARLDYCLENGMIENYDVSLGYSIYLYDREAIDAAITESEAQ